MSEYLPDEVVAQILSRLPVKSVLKCTCVCKLWNSIIKNPNFISTFSSNKHPPYIFIFHSIYFDAKYSMRFDDQDFDEYLSIQAPDLDRLNPFYEVIGSSNGLVCFRIFVRDKLIFWNPCIRRSFVIPHSFRFEMEMLIGFGFDSRTGDNKLLLARLGADSVNNVVLYSLNSNSWREISSSASAGRKFMNYGTLLPSSPAFVDGRFYWLMIVEEKYVILVFDLRDEMFREISLPVTGVYLRPTVGDYLGIKAFEGSVALVLNGSYSDIWVMKEYVTGEWKKLARVENEGKGTGIGTGTGTGTTEVIEFRDNGEALVRFDGGLDIVSYNIRNRCRKNLMVLGSESERILGYRHVESLALLDKDNDTSNQLLLANSNYLNFR